MRLRSAPRHAATVLEAAIIYPAAVFLLISLVIGGMGIFRYQQVSYIAHQTARYTATHGGQYANENATAIQAGTLPDVNDAYLATNIVEANAIAMDTSQLSVQVNLITAGGTFDWDDTCSNGHRMPTSTTTSGSDSTAHTNTVSVTVTYQWLPELYLIGPLTLSSTAVQPMSY
jgi:hypothetical protein